MTPAAGSELQLGNLTTSVLLHRVFALAHAFEIAPAELLH